MTNASELPSSLMDNVVASASKLAHRSGASTTRSSKARVDSISLRIVGSPSRVADLVITDPASDGSRRQGWPWTCAPSAHGAPWRQDVGQWWAAAEEVTRPLPHRAEAGGGEQ